jgi:hypothetical protein
MVCCAKEIIVHARNVVRIFHHLTYYEIVEFTQVENWSYSVVKNQKQNNKMDNNYMYQLL